MEMRGLTPSHGGAARSDDDFHDYYALLGVAWDATREDLERAYRRLVMHSHPDRFVHDLPARAVAEIKLRQLNAVMRVLRDDTLRSHYNECFRRERPLTTRLQSAGLGDAGR